MSKGSTSSGVRYFSNGSPSKSGSGASSSLIGWPAGFATARRAASNQVSEPTAASGVPSRSAWHRPSSGASPSWKTRLSRQAEIPGAFISFSPM